MRRSTTQRTKKNDLNGISIIRCANIFFQLSKGKINEINFLKQPKGKTFPPSKFPKSKKQLKGFSWRESERPQKKEDVFTTEKIKNKGG